MLFVVDIGNTETTWGLFLEDDLKARWSTATVINRTRDDYQVLLSGLLAQKGLQGGEIRQSVICSVVPSLTSIFQEVMRQRFAAEPLIIGAGVKMGIKILMDNPREVGADRIVNALAAHTLYQGAVIVVDMGTATTFDTISADGEYLGGAIAPGLKTSAQALYSATAVLPNVELTKPEKAIGTNTVAAMRSGLIFGYAGLVEGLVKRIKSELRCAVTVVATGGLAPLVALETGAIDILNPDLTLIGLKIAYHQNIDAIQDRQAKKNAKR